MNSRLKPSWLSVADAPDKFTIEVTEYGIEDGKYGESDYVSGSVLNIPRKVRLNQKSLLFLQGHGIDCSEEILKARLVGRKLRFEKTKLGAFTALVVTALVAEKKEKA